MKWSRLYGNNGDACQSISHIFLFSFITDSTTESNMIHSGWDMPDTFTINIQHSRYPTAKEFIFMYN